MSENSPLARLVIFIVCLAIAGSAIAASLYYAGDIPAQEGRKSPENAIDEFNENEVIYPILFITPGRTLVDNF